MGYYHFPHYCFGTFSYRSLDLPCSSRLGLLIYIYIYKERKRERENGNEESDNWACMNNKKITRGERGLGRFRMYNKKGSVLGAMTHNYVFLQK